MQGVWQERNQQKGVTGTVHYSKNERRVATAQGKQGIWFLLFPDRENTGKVFETQGKYF